LFLNQQHTATMFSKKFYLFILLGFFNNYPIFGQNNRTEVLTLKAEQISLPNRKFYIQRIVCDFNQPKYFLIRKGLFSKQKNLVLGDSIQRILMTFLKPSNKYVGGLAPVLMRVKELKIREERHFLKEEGLVKLSVEFYIETDTKPIKIFQSNAFRTYSGFMNVTSKHETNIKEVIKSCIMDFNNAKIEFSKFVIPKVFKAKHTPY
jgi:hypothetical protein